MLSMEDCGVAATIIFDFNQLEALECELHLIAACPRFHLREIFGRYKYIIVGATILILSGALIPTIQFPGPRC